MCYSVYTVYIHYNAIAFILINECVEIPPEGARVRGYYN
jgi:hypothetical protein